MTAASEGLERLWYGRSAASLLLLPLAAFFRVVVGARRRLYRAGILRVTRLPVPVIIVGNIAVGGAGKTPLVAWLVAHLQRRGYRPGIVSRGYGGETQSLPNRVDAHSDPRVAGDEAVLLARQTQCPVMVSPDRVAAAEVLIAETGCDVIVSDDGLQHYALGRDIEIAVVDGSRRLGNRRCLPAGPLREPPSRLNEMDLVLVNGPGPDEAGMHLRAAEAVKLTDRQTRPLREFRGEVLHAVAGIGNPRRFFETLRNHGLSLIEHPFPDHHPFEPADLHFADPAPVLMTEKDAVKCEKFANAQWWYVPVTADVDPRWVQRLDQLLDKVRHGQKIA